MTELQHIKTNEVVDLPELIELQSANITQTLKNGKKSDWEVRKNITGEKLGTFPSFINDQTMFTVLHFARKYELKAFNEGIRFQKKKQNEFLTAQIIERNNLIEALTAENERLATVLEKHIGEH